MGARSIREAIEESTLVGSVFLGGLLGTVSEAAFSPCIETASSAPCGERLRVNVNPDGDYALALKVCLNFLRSLLPVLPSALEHVAVVEDADAGIVIFLPNPSDAAGSGVVVVESGHIEAFSKVYADTKAAIPAHVVKAGVSVLCGFDPAFESDECAVSKIFREMILAAHRGAKSEAS